MPGSLIIGLGGTLRSDSSSESALKVALEAAHSLGASTTVFAASDLDLPFYDPKESARTPKASTLIEAFRQADGVVVCSPGYHGASSGMIKNALDYVEDLVGDDRVYLADLPVGCIGMAYGAQAAVSVVGGLRTIAHALRAFPTPYGAAVVARPGLFAGGLCTDPEIATQLQLVGRQVVEYAVATRRARLSRRRPDGLRGDDERHPLDPTPTGPGC